MTTNQYPEYAPEPEVTVLLATRNGRTWIDEQVDSILGQTGVAVHILALDDKSTDGTAEWLIDRARREPRLTVLPSEGASGSAAANFYRLVKRWSERQSSTDESLVAFADQDDIWMSDKLARHARMLREGSHDGISSNVTSFTPSGIRTLIRKSYPQREFDYLLESPGPGSTFLMTGRLMRLTDRVLADDPRAQQVQFHDWLVYALARSAGWSWHIDDQSTVDYRQHGANAMGSNVGLASAMSRLRLIAHKWHRRQATLLAEIGLQVAAPHIAPGLAEMRRLFLDRGPRASFALARRASQLRRRPRDQRIMAILIASGIW